MPVRSNRCGKIFCPFYQRRLCPCVSVLFDVLAHRCLDIHVSAVAAVSLSRTRLHPVQTRFSAHAVREYCTWPWSTRMLMYEELSPGLNGRSTGRALSGREDALCLLPSWHLVVFCFSLSEAEERLLVFRTTARSVSSLSRSFSSRLLSSFLLSYSRQKRSQSGHP